MLHNWGNAEPTYIMVEIIRAYKQRRIDLVEPKWMIYIVAHKTLYPEMYHCKGLMNKHFSILNVGSSGTIENNMGLNVINQYELDDAVRLGANWTESEGIYNVWRSHIWDEYDYVGFVHYDLEFRLNNKVKAFRRQNIINRIKRGICKNDSLHISFETHSFEHDFSQKIMADFRDIEANTGDGRNCFYYILEEYNEFFGTDYAVEDLFAIGSINLCSCFFVDVHHYDEMMKWWDWVIRKGQIALLDPQRILRKQGTMAERFFGVYLMLNYSSFIDLSLIHHCTPVRKAPR